MPYTKAQYDTLLSDDSNEADALNRVTGRYEYLTATYPTLTQDAVAAMVNAVSMERANQSNESILALTAAQFTNTAALTAAISGCWV